MEFDNFQVGDTFCLFASAVGGLRKTGTNDIGTKIELCLRAQKMLEISFPKEYTRNWQEILYYQINKHKLGGRQSHELRKIYNIKNI